MEPLKQELEQSQTVKESLKRFKADLQRKETQMGYLKTKLESTIAVSISFSTPGFLHLVAVT
jgi:hypothetical protein